MDCVANGGEIRFILNKYLDLGLWLFTHMNKAWESFSKLSTKLLFQFANNAFKKLKIIEKLSIVKENKFWLTMLKERLN